MEKRNISRLFTREIAVQALKDSFIKLNPSALVKNPVIFIVAIGAVMTTVVVILDIN
jgi:K+-transporting ATPase ATPase B chain